MPIPPRPWATVRGDRPVQSVPAPRCPEVASSNSSVDGHQRAYYRGSTMDRTNGRFQLGLAIGVVLALLLSAGVGPVSANHSVPAPLYFWDPDDNAAPGPEPRVDADGGFWSASHLNRLNEAVAEWSSDTDFDVSTIASGSQKAYVDGRFAPCLPNGYNLPNGGVVLAVVCASYVPRTYPGTSFGYYKIVDLDLYFNMENPDSPDWWVGTTYPPDPDRIHFLGILTHELGHWVLLNDIPDSSCTHTAAGFYTMCGLVVDLDQDSWRMTSLHSDDISAANFVYP